MLQPSWRIFAYFSFFRMLLAPVLLMQGKSTSSWLSLRGGTCPKLGFEGDASVTMGDAGTDDGGVAIEAERLFEASEAASVATDSKSESSRIPLLLQWQNSITNVTFYMWNNKRHSPLTNDLDRHLCSSKTSWQPFVSTLTYIWDLPCHVGPHILLGYVLPNQEPVGTVVPL